MADPLGDVGQCATPPETPYAPPIEVGASHEYNQGSLFLAAGPLNESTAALTHGGVVFRSRPHDDGVKTLRETVASIAGPEHPLAVDMLAHAFSIDPTVSAPILELQDQYEGDDQGFQRDLAQALKRMADTVKALNSTVKNQVWPIKDTATLSLNDEESLMDPSRSMERIMLSVGLDHAVQVVKRTCEHLQRSMVDVTNTDQSQPVMPGYGVQWQAERLKMVHDACTSFLCDTNKFATEAISDLSHDGYMQVGRDVPKVSLGDRSVVTAGSLASHMAYLKEQTSPPIVVEKHGPHGPVSTLVPEDAENGAVVDCSTASQAFCDLFNSMASTRNDVLPGLGGRQGQRSGADSSRAPEPANLDW